MNNKHKTFLPPPPANDTEICKLIFELSLRQAIDLRKLGDTVQARNLVGYENPEEALIETDKDDDCS